MIDMGTRWMKSTDWPQARTTSVCLLPLPSRMGDGAAGTALTGDDATSSTTRSARTKWIEPRRVRTQAEVKHKESRVG